MKNRLAILFVVALTVISVGNAADRFFHVAAHNSGANNTMWLTDAQVFNPDSTDSIVVRLAFLESGENNTAASEVPITVGPRQGVLLEDLVASVLGRAEPGSIRLVSDALFFASSRTYNIGDGESGTYGQYIASASTDEAMAQGVLLLANNDPALDGFRTNVGFVNPGSGDVAIQISIFDAEIGVMIGSTSLNLQPLGFQQLNDIFEIVGEHGAVWPNASIEFLATAPVLAYASIVDNTSGDAIFVTPRVDTGTLPSDNNPPMGTIDQPSEDVTITPGGSVFFSASASDPDDDDVTVLWDFGDGMTSTELEPGDHTYAEVGQYLVSLTATDEEGLSDPTPFTRTVTVQSANAPPNATIIEPSIDVSITAGGSVFFSGSANDPDDDDVTVLWDLGDGTTSTTLVPGSHTYTSEGVYTVTLTATDDQDLADPTPATRTITVEGANAAPNATIIEPSIDVSITAGASVFFSGSASDPDGDPVTVLWSFGDGTTSTSLVPGSHSYPSEGVYTVTLTATDDQNLTDPTPATRTVTVEGANSPPNATITQPSGNVTIAAGASVFFAGSVSDPDGDPVTVLWDFGDGMTTTTLNPGNHTYSSPGTFAVTLTATDDQGLADPSPATRTITVTAAATTLTQVQNQIFTPLCDSCHGGGSPTANLNLEDGQAHADLVNVPATTEPGTRVIPGNPNSSVLVTFLEDGHRGLSQSQINLIRDWITSGAPDN